MFFLVLDEIEEWKLNFALYTGIATATIVIIVSILTGITTSAHLRYVDGITSHSQLIDNILSIAAGGTFIGASLCSLLASAVTTRFDMGIRSAIILSSITFVFRLFIYFIFARSTLPAILIIDLPVSILGIGFVAFILGLLGVVIRKILDFVALPFIILYGVGRNIIEKIRKR